MVLKPKPTVFILAVPAGAFFIWASGTAMINLREFSWGISIFGLLGCLLSFVGVHSLLNRSRNVIVIDESGITITRFGKSLRISRLEIESIKPFAELRGRGISIQFNDGQVFQFSCREYCSISRFIEHCKTVGLPCA